MTDNFAVAATTQAHNADIEFFVRRGMTKGYQLLSVLTPPVYAVFALSRYGRGHLSVNRLLRATWMGGSFGTLYISYSALCYLLAHHGAPRHRWGRCV